MKRLTLLALAAALAVPAAASAQNHVDVGDHVPAAQDASASILFAAFDPGRNDVLAGDRVTWTNGSVRKHTVTAVDASFNSGQLLGGEQFSHTFGAPGSYAYYCSLHPFMRGEVDVHEVLLARPEAAASPAKPFVCAGAPRCRRTRR